MTRLFIPAPGTRLTLAADWQFRFTQDWRSKGLVSALRLRPTSSYYDKPEHDVTIPMGAVIKLDTYNLKRTVTDPKYLEMAVVLCGREVPVKVNGHVIKSSARFYVALEHINRIEFGGIKSSHSILQ
jgi:hypothetical protein